MSFSLRISRSSLSSLNSVPAYFWKRTGSPSLSSTGMRWPVSGCRSPGPTARTLPSCGFSLAVSGRTIPLFVISSRSRPLTTTREPSGLSLSLGCDLGAVATATCISPPCWVGASAICGRHIETGLALARLDCQHSTPGPKSGQAGLPGPWGRSALGRVGRGERRLHHDAVLSRSLGRVEHRVGRREHLLGGPSGAPAGDARADRDRAPGLAAAVRLPRRSDALGDDARFVERGLRD